MRILGLDTSSHIASVALIEAGRLIAEASHPPESGALPSISAKGGHSEFLLPLIEAVLDRAGKKLDDIGTIAIALGPGSFTGLRIGLATVKGLAYNWQIPLFTLSSLEAQAARVKDYSGLICPLLDARKEEVYAALFEATEGKIRRRLADQVVAVAALGDLLREFEAAPIAFIGSGAERYGEKLLAFFGSRARIVTAADCYSAAHALAVLAWQSIGRDQGVDLGSLVPLYLGASQASVKASGTQPNPLK